MGFDELARRRRTAEFAGVGRRREEVAVNIEFADDFSFAKRDDDFRLCSSDRQDSGIVLTSSRPRPAAGGSGSADSLLTGCGVGAHAAAERPRTSMLDHVVDHVKPTHCNE